MILSERSIKYADLMVPLRKCPLGEAVPDCPFVEYWENEDPSYRVQLIAELPEDKLDDLRDFHRNCLAAKIKQARQETAQQYKDQKV